MTAPLSLAWGVTDSTPIPNTACAAWGARAIYHDGQGSRAGAFAPRRGASSPTFDLLPDRTDAAGDPADVRELGRWLEREGLPELRRKLKAANRRASESFRVYVHSGRFGVLADSRGSCGYLYMTAWRFGVEPAGPRPADHPDAGQAPPELGQPGHGCDS